MPSHRVRIFTFKRSCLLLALTGCAAGESTTTGFSANPTGVTGAAATGSSGEPASTGGGSEDDTGGTGDAATSTTGGVTSAGTAPNPDGLPNGAECEGPAECMTGNCYQIMLPIDDLPPGICSECDADADCVAAGSGISCTVDSATLGGVCTDGGLGSYCESQAACQPQFFCDPIIAGAEGLLPNACNECRVDSDCAAPKRCVPAIDVAAYTGRKSCVAPATVPQGGLCPLSNGNPMCTSGICSVLEIGGLIDVGVCGQCTADADCVQKGLTTCVAPKFDSGFFGSECM